MIPENQEHIEARQQEVNRQREDFIKTLPPEDQRKFKAVEDAIKILLDAKIKFFLFPQLPFSKDTNKQQVWQWNSLCELRDFDNSGKPTEKFIKEWRIFINSLIYGFVHFLNNSQPIPITNKDEFDKFSEHFKNVIFTSYFENVRYIEEPNETSVN